MRVLVLTQHFEPEENAPAFRWTWLARGLAARGAQVDVITAAWRDAADTHIAGGRVRVHRVRNVLRGAGLGYRLVNELFVALKSVAKAIRVPRPDVIIVSAPPVGATLYSQPLRFLLRRPVVLELRDMWPELFDEFHSWSDYGDGPTAGRLKTAVGGIAIRVLRPLMMSARRRADMLVTTSESFAERARSEGHPNVLCVRNGALERAPLPKKQFDGTLKVLYLGNLGRAQYLATAIRAAEIVTKSGHDMVLRLVGHGAHGPALQRMAKRTDANIEIVRSLPRNEIDCQYQWADSILVMLRDWDGMRYTVPSKLYEVAGIGKHVTGSLAGETADLIDSAGLGHTVPPEDPQALADLWIRLIQHPELLSPSGNADALIAETNVEYLSDKYHSALQKLCDG